jgi:hypothetical protein
VTTVRSILSDVRIDFADRFGGLCGGSQAIYL